MEKDAKSKLDGRLSWANTRFYAWLLIPLALFFLALISRLYNLSTFPYFKVGWPTCGGLPNCAGAFPSLPGLYDDEVTDVLAAKTFGTILSNFGGGPVPSLLILISTRALGMTVFAIRLPFAVVSSITAVFVYFTTRTIAGDRISAILSASYFILMMPALVYGRMAFGENLIALLFIINLYSTIKINRSPDAQSSKRWFLLAGLSAAFSIIVKVEGIIVILYFFVFLFRTKLLRRGGPYLGFAVAAGFLLPLAILQLITGRALNLLMTRLYPFVVEMGNQLALPRFFFLDTLPSGAVVAWKVYDVPEFWYIFLYVALAALIIYSYKEYSDLLFALGVFVVFIATFSGAFGSYWMILIQPILAIALGPGLKRLLNMPLVAALAFYAFLFVPLITSIGEYLFTPTSIGINPIVDNALFFWNLSIAVPVAALLLLSARKYATNPKWRTWVNGALLVAFFVSLLVGSFLLPDLYPYYITRII